MPQDITNPAPAIDTVPVAPTPAPEPTPLSVEDTFNYPNLGIVVTATSKAEADKKVAAIINTKSK